MVLNDTRTHMQSRWKACNLGKGTQSEHTKRRCISEAKMLGIPKTRKQVMKALALTTPSQLSFHFVV
jgi:lipid II:glycine glycyltransferase (peptidoglycan interpeptide bridge formation enzyme)